MGLKKDCCGRQGLHGIRDLASQLPSLPMKENFTWPVPRTSADHSVCTLGELSSIPSSPAHYPARQCPDHATSHCFLLLHGCLHDYPCSILRAKGIYLCGGGMRGMGLTKNPTLEQWGVDSTVLSEYTGKGLEGNIPDLYKTL